MAVKAEKEGEAVLMETLADIAKHFCSKGAKVNQVKMVATVFSMFNHSKRRPSV
jgi:hypothetical protein